MADFMRGLLTDPATHGGGVSVYDVAGVRDPEVEYQKYYKAAMSGDRNPKLLDLLNFWAERTGRTSFTRNAHGDIVPSNASTSQMVTPQNREGPVRIPASRPNMPPAWS
jgi:hypothetical protein